MAQIKQKDIEVMQAYSTTAKSAFDAHNQEYMKLVQSNPEVGASLINTTTQYKYFSSTAFAGVFFSTIATELWDWDNHDNRVGSYSGLAGGLAFGAGLSWGAAWLNFPISSLNKVDSRFQANILPGAINVNWWKMDGTFIGSFAGGGIPAGAGIIGGQGSFSGN